MTDIKVDNADEKILKKSYILVVDDSAIQRQVLNNILSNQGYLVREAVDGENALFIISKEAPDLILLDVTMPGINGFEVCEKIKNRQKTSDIPVLFVTSNVEYKDKVKGFKSGGVDYITKPYHPEEVLVRVNTQLRLKSAIDAVKEHSDRLSEMLDERTKELIRTERQAAFGQFVQGIVHNINNPLTTILGSIELIDKKLKKLRVIKENKSTDNIQNDDSSILNIQSNLVRVKRGAEGIIDITKSLLKKSISDQKEKFEVIDLNDIIEQELSFLEAHLWYKHHVEKTINLSECPLHVNAVPSMIAQVFENLIRNALDAMNKTPSPKLTIMSGMNEKEVWFSIADNGHGIPKENMPRIFDPFFTTKSKDNTSQGSEPKGTGLGLYMCLDMITLNRGKIDVESSEKSGTTFCVRLPKLDKSKISSK